MSPKYPVTPARITMYDAADARNLPPFTGKAAGYLNGLWPSYDAITARFPHAQVHAIDVLGTAAGRARILDYEPGNPVFGKPDKVRQWVTGCNTAAPETAVIYTDKADLGNVEDFTMGLWHVLWVANWGPGGTRGVSMTGARTEAGNLIVATQLQNLRHAGFDLSDSLQSW